MLFHDLETSRLLLKRISPDDREFILREFSDADVNRYLFDAAPMRDISEADDLISFYTAPEPRMQHRWILTLKVGGERIGTCGFHKWDAEKRVAELGYDMLKPHWGKGYMSEALDAALDFGAREMGLKRVEACISVDNANSVKLAARKGFAFTGEIVNFDFMGGSYPHYIYALEF